KKNSKTCSKIKQLMNSKKECEQEFVEALSKATVESSKGKLFSKRLVINRSFLVDRDKINEFSEILGKLDDKYAALKINYTGPWPPYNFVDIRIMGRGR
ncbi:MAG: GvpL/GvpF family gas vesicle protein, partial [Nanoarchaeota archaeon]|nr:GvpL/GvpF family gas vesicle protein [Nanoarchaeota archaeon]